MKGIIRDELGAPKIVDRGSCQAELDALRETRGEMIFNTTHSVHPDVGRRREWPKASADRWLSLAAAPIFAIMALLAAIQDVGMPGMLCSATHDAWPLTGMVPMYLLMSAFHSAPWLRLIAQGAVRNGLTMRSRLSSTIPCCISSDQSVSQSASSAEAAIIAS